MSAKKHSLCRALASTLHLSDLEGMVYSMLKHMEETIL